MPEPSRIKLDNGAANDRILAKEGAPDYRRVEQASIKQRARFESPEVKRLFVRFFHTLQLNGHFVSDIARTRLAPEEVEKVEAMIRQRLEALGKEIDASIDGAAALFEREVLTTTASYDTQPLEMDVGVVSSFGRRYLQALQKLDRLMPMLKTLEIYEVISMAQADKQRALLKRHVRDVASTARRLANGLRRRMSDEQQRTASAVAVRGPVVAVASGMPDTGSQTTPTTIGATSGRADEPGDGTEARSSNVDDAIVLELDVPTAED